MTGSSPIEGPHRDSRQTKLTTDLEGDRYRLDFSVEKSIRYHARRQAHYEWIHRAMMFLVILFGSASVSAVFPAWIGVGAAVVGAWDLVWSFSTKARDHYFLRMRFSELANDIRGGNATKPNLTKWKMRRVDIEKDEPPVFWAVAKDCHNEVCEAWGQPDRDSINGLEYWFMNWLRFERIGHAASSQSTVGSPDAPAPRQARASRPGEVLREKDDG